MSLRLAGVALVLLAGVAAALLESAPTTSRLFLLPLAASLCIWLLALARLRRGATASAALVLSVSALMHLPFAFTSTHSDDVYRYLWEGRIQQHGFNPYAHAPDDPALTPLRDRRHARVTHPELPSIYPPLAQASFRAAAALGLSERAFRGGILLLDLLVAAVLCGWLRSAGRSTGWALLYAWSPLAVAASAGGHVDPLMLLFLAGAGWAWTAKRHTTAGVLLGVAVLSKTMAVLLLPWLLLRRPRTAMVVIAVVVLGYLPYADAGAGLVETLVAFGGSFSFNGSVYRLLEWSLTPALARGLVAALLVVWVGVVSVSQPRFAVAGALLFAGLLLLSPTVHFWYLTWFLVLLPLCGDRRWVAPLCLWCATIVFSAETYRALGAGEIFRERFPLTLWIYLPPLLVAVWLLVRAWPRRRRLEPSSAAPAAVVSGAVVILPCCGEARNLRSLLPRWLATPVRAVIVADTPTDDGTEQLARGERILYERVTRKGYGAAVAQGIARARAIPGAQWAVVADADHAGGPDQIASLLAPGCDPEVALICAARDPASVTSFAQRAGNGLTTLLIAFGWGRRFHDLGPYRALRLDAWEGRLPADPAFGWNVEMNVRALESGLGVREVPLPASIRPHGRNRISGTLRGIAGAGYGMLRRLYILRENGI